ncbi:hypothetical protein M569_08959 [Genlisea aurea]|uniref:HAUS augmin-like complex subunit 6 N-terminal domain-containing protein n=1 Tax=Genlisea aurea TaxID=192259 RepID=S8CFV4_9LAMI|nr:hypothetical protein M569_08959 [Genlisea aurea]
MTMDREKEREMELESAMYTNCLLLGLDPTVIGIGSNNGAPRVGLFRHSNPKLGEQLLYFILSSLRGPAQSAKARLSCSPDFDKVWPIFDSAQSRDFRKVVQGIISELEAQGALPRSNSRVSSLATCCGPRFVELLWQLSLHALREVHRRNFPADVTSNPQPAPLTDVAFSHAATLLPVTKARIALERRRFLKNAEIGVQRQAMWSELAHEMTAEFRGLCAEEAYLQQELEKLQDLRNKVKLEGELWDELVSSSSQNSHIVQRATRLWDSLLSRKSQHEILASGPIEDLIAHREHRYRISGSSLLAAMDQGNILNPRNLANGETMTTSPEDLPEVSKSNFGGSEANNSLRVDQRINRGQPTVDIAEVLRRWTHALQRIHKQSLQLANANGGEGPELLRHARDDSGSSHAESLAATLAEHHQHLDSIQVLINQLKDVAPAIQDSIAELSDEVNGITSNLPSVMQLRSNSGGRNAETGDENRGDVVVDLASRVSSVHLEKAAAAAAATSCAPPPALKLPPLFSCGAQRRLNGDGAAKEPPGGTAVDRPTDDGGGGSSSAFVQKLRRSVREAALGSTRGGGSQPSLPPASRAVEGWSSPAADQVMSPPLFMDAEAYEDLLAPLSEMEAALMEH